MSVLHDTVLNTAGEPKTQQVIVGLTKKGRLLPVIKSSFSSLQRLTSPPLSPLPCAWSNNLSSQASAPYFATLQDWIYGGKVDDPALEFMVAEKTALSGRDVASPGFSDHYWLDRYSLLHDKIPNFLQQVSLEDLFDVLASLKFCLFHRGKRAAHRLA